METTRIVIVTGGAQNIGAAIVARFKSAGDTVICADLNPPVATGVEFHRTDVTEESSVANLMAWIAEEFGHLEVLVNNAGISIEAPIAETTESDWDRVMAINVKGAFLTTKHALPLMRNSAAQGPAIVNISSIEGLGANPLHSAYAASKAAIAAFSHNTALEYGPYGIRCNSVAPGWINTPFNEQFLSQYPDRDAVDVAIAALHPIGRLGTPEDVANTVFWLASSEAAFITGQEVIVDGGRLAKLPLPDLAQDGAQL